MAWLAEQWEQRMGERERVDLDEDPSIVPELLTAWTPNGFQLQPFPGAEIRRDSGGKLIVNFTAKLNPLSGSSPECGMIERRLDLGAGVAKHIRLELPEHARRQQKGRRMLGASVQTYEALGLRRVSLSAVAIGRYVWAMCGFGFSTPDARSTMAQQLGGWIREHGISFAGFDWETFEPFDVAYAESDQPLALRDWLELLDEDSGIYSDLELARIVR